jgi:RimJ/RimL family protein N-acetyltransferase
MHETITTTRLIVRPARLDDAPEVFNRYAADPEVTRFLQWRPQPSVEAVRGFLRRCEVERARRAESIPGCWRRARPGRRSG